MVLAYSGGLDTSIILKWLKDTYDCEARCRRRPQPPPRPSPPVLSRSRQVITFTADLGQGEELEPARRKAELMGVRQIFVVRAGRRCAGCVGDARATLLLGGGGTPLRASRPSDAVAPLQDDCREEFVRDFVFPMFRANALYEGTYMLGTSIARPLIAKRQIDIARATGADAVCHGATGKGNDQVRFELAYYALKPDIKARLCCGV